MLSAAVVPINYKLFPVVGYAGFELGGKDDLCGDGGVHARGGFRRRLLSGATCGIDGSGACPSIRVTTDLLIADVSCGNASALSRVPVECIIGATITFPPGEALGYVQREVAVAVEDAAQHDPAQTSSPLSRTIARARFSQHVRRNFRPMRRRDWIDATMRSAAWSDFCDDPLSGRSPIQPGVRELVTVENDGVGLVFRAFVDSDL